MFITSECVYLRAMEISPAVSTNPLTMGTVHQQQLNESSETKTSLADIVNK